MIYDEHSFRWSEFCHVQECSSQTDHAHRTDRSLTLTFTGLIYGPSFAGYTTVRLCSVLVPWSDCGINSFLAPVSAEVTRPRRGGKV